MHNQILNGQRIGLNTNYCIGSFKDNALHLNPVSHVLQFRPEFGVLDETNQNRKNRERGKDKYSKTAEVTESVNKAQDEWINLEYINENEMKNFLLKEKLYSEDNMDEEGYGNLKNKHIDFISNEEYYNFLYKNINIENISETYTESLTLKAEKQAPIKETKDMPLDKKIEYFIRKMHLTSLNFMLSVLKEPKQNEKLILEILSKYVNVLRNGHLVLRSDVRYENKKNMIPARNQVIAILQHNLQSGTEKAAILSAINIDKETLNEILSEVAITTLGKWYLKETKTDIEFIQKFTDFYKENSTFWDQTIEGIKGPVLKHPLIIPDKKIIREEPVIKTPVKQVPIKTTTEMIPQTTSVKKEDKIEMNATLIDNSNVDGNRIPPFNLDVRTIQNKALESEFIKFFDDKGGCIYENSIIDFLQTDLGLKRSDYDNDLTLFLKNNCYKIANTYFIKSLNDASLDPIRQTILEYFLVKENAKKNELQEILNKKEIKFTENNLKKVLKKIAVFQNGKWIAKTPETIND